MVGQTVQLTYVASPTEEPQSSLSFFSLPHIRTPSPRISFSVSPYATVSSSSILPNAFEVCYCVPVALAAVLTAGTARGDQRECMG